MSNPNLLSITSVVANMAVAIATTTPTSLVTNSAASDKVYKITAILISNTTTTTESIDIIIKRNDVSYFLTKDISVPVGSTLDALNKLIYLNEGDSIFVSASANTSLHVICSYEEIS
jgi:hypothetical protein